jgi:hypothetical protein
MQTQINDLQKQVQDLQAQCQEMQQTTAALQNWCLNLYFNDGELIRSLSFLYTCVADGSDFPDQARAALDPLLPRNKSLTQNELAPGTSWPCRVVLGPCQGTAGVLALSGAGMTALAKLKVGTTK